MTAKKLKNAWVLKLEAARLKKQLDAAASVGVQSADLKKKQAKLEKALARALSEELRAIEFIDSIPDPLTRFIFSCRYLDGMSYGEIARKLGGGNTSDGVRKIVDRHLDAKKSKR